MRRDGAADVARVPFAERIFDVLADCVQLDTQVFDVRVGQMREFFDVCNRHALNLPCGRVSTTYAIVTYVPVSYLSDVTSE